MHQRGQTLGVKQSRNAVQILPRLLRFDTAQIVLPGAGVRVEIGKRRLLCLECFQASNQNDVLENVGKISGVIGVPVIQIEPPAFMFRVCGLR